MRSLYVKLFVYDRGREPKRIKLIPGLSRRVDVRTKAEQRRLWKALRIAVATFEAEEVIRGDRP